MAKRRTRGRQRAECDAAAGGRAGSKKTKRRRGGEEQREEEDGMVVMMGRLVILDRAVDLDWKDGQREGLV
jgi:hypothetical protein